jgi:signal recognition particle subunit SRP54
VFESLSERLGSALAALRGRRELSDQNIEEGLLAVRAALLEADVHFQVVKDMVERVRASVVGAKVLPGVEPAQQFVHAVHRALVEAMGPEDARLAFAKHPPTVILLAGLQGSGKTTTCAKLAQNLRDKHQLRPLMVAADTKRPAAVEQLRVLGTRLGIPVFHREGLTPAEVCVQGLREAQALGRDAVLLDTAGRLHVDEELMREVAEIAGRTQPHQTLLVCDAMTGQDAVRSAQAFHAHLRLSGLILTKLDGDARGGAALSLKAVTGAPILFVGVGEKLDDLAPFHPERMAGRILGLGDVVGLVEQAQEKISDHEAQAAYEKMVLGSFTLEDMLAQIRMFRRLGPMKKVLGMLPGMGALADKVEVDDRKMNRLEALFTSMTPFERLHPDCLDMSRRRRVARGSGQDVAAINELLKSYKGMKQMMREMNKLGLGARFGMKQKRAALERLAPGNASPGAPDLGLDALLGGGGPERARGVPGLGSLGPGGILGGPRPMGSSSTRQSGSRRKKEKRRKKKRR